MVFCTTLLAGLISFSIKHVFFINLIVARVIWMSNDKIKVAILGVGNWASSFVQGIEHYSNSDDEDGLISDVIGGYKVSDI